MAMHKLSVDQLQIDTPLPWDVYDAAGQLLLRRGYVLERNSQLEALLERGMFVQQEAFKATQNPPPIVREQRFDPFWLWQDIPVSYDR